MLVTSNMIDIEVDKKQIYRYLGYGSDYKPPVRISVLIDEYIEHARHLIDPAHSYVIRNIEQVECPSVFVEGSVVFKSKVVATLLEKSTKVAVFVATISSRLEEMACQLARDGLVLQSAVLDAIGSSATENVADFVQDRIREMANAQGLCASHRFSPGYCDWAIKQQKTVFQALVSDTAGVRLTKGYLMIPRKSISGIIGIGPCDPSNVENYNPCQTCTEYDCMSRRSI